MEAKFKEGDRVLFYGEPAVVKAVEVRRAGFPDYFIEMDRCCTWAQENELEGADDIHAGPPPTR